MATLFPTRVRRDEDPQTGVQILQTMLEFLRDALDKYTGSIQSGSATVLNGNTTVVVSFTLSPGATFKVQITPQVDPGGRWWVSNKTSSGFTINLQVAAPVSGVAFDWLAKGV